MTEGPRPIHPVAAWAALAFASLGVFLGGAELMVVAIALPSIVADFGGWADLARVSWIVNAYLLAYVVAMPLAGRGADLWGARRLYVLALLLFVVGSAGAGLSRFAGPEDGLTWLIVARVVQGFGGGALVPLSMALASHLFIGRSRSVALGLEGAATYVGMAIGPAYGAWVLLNFSLPIPGLDMASWQWIFLLNVPIGIVTLLLIYVVAGGIETPRVRGTLDLVGALLLSVALVAGIGSVTVSGATGWTDPLVIGGLALAAASAAAFAWYELRSQSPLVDLRLFADRAFSASNAVSLLTGYTLATAIIGGPVFVNRVLFGSDAEAATVLTSLTLAIAAGALVGGLASGFIGERIVAVAGVILTAVGLWPGARMGCRDRARSAGVRPRDLRGRLRAHGLATRHGGGRGRRPGRLRGGERHAPDHPHGRHEHRARAVDLHRPEPDRRALGADRRSTPPRRARRLAGPAGVRRGRPAGIARPGGAARVVVAGRVRGGAPDGDEHCARRRARHGGAGLVRPGPAGESQRPGSLMSGPGRPR